MAGMERAGMERPGMERSGPAGPALWGHADYNDLSGDADGALDWDGHVFSLHLGVDIRPRHDLVVGAALSRSLGSFDYADRPPAAADGRYRSRMTGLHPYAGWFSPNMTLWATAGYGRGEVEIDDDEAGPAIKRRGPEDGGGGGQRPAAVER